MYSSLKTERVSAHGEVLLMTLVQMLEFIKEQAKEKAAKEKILKHLPLAGMQTSPFPD